MWKIPSLDNGEDFAIQEAGFRTLKFSLWEQINKLHTDDVEIQQLVKSSIMEDDKWATLLQMPIGFLTPRPTFKKGVEQIMRTMTSRPCFKIV